MNQKNDNLPSLIIFIAAILLVLSANHSLALPNDRYESISIEADSALLNEKQGLTRYQGNVILRQGSLLLKADELTITQDPKTQEADTVIATGNPAYFEQQVEIDGEIVTAKSQNITYRASTQAIDLVGNAELRQGDSIIRSDSIVYSAEKQLFQAKQSNTNGSKQRVKVSLPAPQKKTANP